MNSFSSLIYRVYLSVVVIPLVYTIEVCAVTMAAVHFWSSQFHKHLKAVWKKMCALKINCLKNISSIFYFTQTCVNCLLPWHQKHMNLCHKRSLLKMTTVYFECFLRKFKQNPSLFFQLYNCTLLRESLNSLNQWYYEKLVNVNDDF